MSDAAKKLPAPATHPLADSLIGEWQREFPDLDEKTLAQFVGENGSTLRTHLQAEWSKELHIAGLGAVVGDTPSQTELFFVTVFGEGATDGDVCVMRADSNTITDRDLDAISEFVSAGPDGEAWVSMQTRSEDTKLWEQAAIAAHPKDINRFKDMPPASVKLRHAEGDVYLIWLLKDTVDLRKDELAKQLTDAAPLPGFGGWSIEAVDTDLTYELKDLQSIMVPPAPAAGEVVRYGDVDPELLAREMTLALSPQGQQTKPGNWRNKPFTVQQLIDILSLHKIGEKDGACILQGPVIDGKRMANAVPHLDLLIIDLDTGQSIDEMRAKLQEKGLFAIIYTTHSHGKEGSEIKRDELIKHLDGNTKFDLSDICNYLITKKRYQPELLEGAELVDSGAHTGEGIKVRIRHKPMPKFRVVLVLKEPFVIKDRADTQQEAIKIWKELYAGASQMLGAYFDRSCVDPSRLFFTPRHPKTAKEWRVEIIAGSTLDIDTCERISAEDVRRASLDPMEREAEDIRGNRGKDYKTDQLKWFFAKYGERFDVDTFLMDRDADGDRGSRTSGVGRVHRCPNDDAHSNAGDAEDKGFFCVNGTESERGGAVAHCSHDSCSTLDRMDFVDMICERVDIKDATELKKYVPRTKEDEAEEKAEAASTEETIAGTDDKPVRAFKNFDSAKAAAEAIVERAKTGDKAGIPRAVERLAEGLGLTRGVEKGHADEIRDMLCSDGKKTHAVGASKATFRDAFKRGRDQRAADDREKAKAEAAKKRTEVSVDWLPDDFREEDGWIFVQATEEAAFKVCKMFSKPPVQVRDPEGSGWALEIAFRNNDGVEKTLIASGRRVQNDKPGLRGDFQSAGLGFATGRARDFFAELLTALLADENLPKIREMKRPGWDKSFSTWTSSMGEVVGGGEGEVYRLSGAGGVADREKSGTLEGEKDVLAAAWELDSTYRRFCTLLPFQGPVGQLARLMGGGFWPWGVEGTGKSDGARTAVMPHSNPSKGGNFVRLDATENALEATFIQGTGCMVVLDETKGKKAQAAAVAAAMKVESGSESGRMAYKQSADQVQNKATVNFHVTNLLITSERSMEAIFAEEKRALVPGEVIRICPLKLPPKSEGRLSPDHPLLKRLDGWKDNHGWTAPEFVAKLIEAGWNAKEKRAELTDAINELAIKLVGEWLDGVRAARKFAAVWWAGEFAREHELIPVSADVEECVRGAWQMFLDSPESKRLQGGEHALERVRGYVAGNMRRTILPAEAANSTDWQAQVADGWFTDTHIFLLRDRLVAMVNNEFQLDVVLKGLEPVCEARKHAGRDGTQARIVHEYVPVVGWSNTPHVRIDRKAFGLSVGGGDTGGVTEELDLEGLKEKADRLAARLRDFNWPVPELAIGATTSEGQKTFLKLRVKMLELACDALDERVRAGAR